MGKVSDENHVMCAEKCTSGMKVMPQWISNGLVLFFHFAVWKTINHATESLNDVHGACFMTSLVLVEMRE